jgi:D-alanine-D-alanine ligase
MRIGLTYDMRDDYRAMGYSEEAIAEFDSVATIEALESTLASLGHEIDRIGHIRELAARLVAGERWDLVFNFAEGLKGRSREAQVPALLEAYDIPYVFSDPLVMAVCLDKAVAKRLAREAGVPTAGFAVVASEADLATVDLQYPLFVKPIAEGTGKGCEFASIARDPDQLRRVAVSLIDRFSQPVLVETFLPGREFTVGILGNGSEARVIGVMEIELLSNAEPMVYSLLNKEECESRVSYALKSDVEARRAAKVALKAYHALQCRDACRIDLRCDARGRPYFIEANPLAGLHPSHSDLPMLAHAAGISYRELLREIVDAACRRAGLASTDESVGRAA